MNRIISLSLSPSVCYISTQTSTVKDHFVIKCHVNMCDLCVCCVPVTLALMMEVSSCCRWERVCEFS